MVLSFLVLILLVKSVVKCFSCRGTGGLMIRGGRRRVTSAVGEVSVSVGDRIRRVGHLTRGMGSDRVIETCLGGRVRARRRARRLGS